MKRTPTPLVSKAFASLVCGLLLFATTTISVAQSQMSDDELADLIASCSQVEKTWFDALLDNSYRSKGLTGSYETEGAQDCGRLFPAVQELEFRQAHLKGELDNRSKEVEQLKAAQVDLQAELARTGEAAAADSQRAMKSINSLRQKVAAQTASGATDAQLEPAAANEAQLHLQRVEEQNQKFKSEIAALRTARAELLSSMSDNEGAADVDNEELGQLKNQILSLKATLADRDKEHQRFQNDLAKAKHAANQSRTEVDELQNLLRQQTEKNPDQQLMLELESVRRAKLSLELDLKATGAEAARLTMVENQARGALEAASSHNMQLRGQIETLQSQLSKPVEPTVSNPVTENIVVRSENAKHNKLMTELDEVSRDVALVNGRAVLGNRVLFEKGSAELSDDGKAVLFVLSGVIKKVMKGEKNWVLQVDGHTDSDPISNDQYPSNWYLASGRAIAVVDALVSNGVKSRNLSAVAFAEFQPRDKKDTSKAKAINRRIELRLSNYQTK